jgi:hypothetical protein
MVSKEYLAVTGALLAVAIVATAVGGHFINRQLDKWEESKKQDSNSDLSAVPYSHGEAAYGEVIEYNEEVIVVKAINEINYAIANKADVQPSTLAVKVGSFIKFEKAKTDEKVSISIISPRAEGCVQRGTVKEIQETKDRLTLVVETESALGFSDVILLSGNKALFTDVDVGTFVVAVTKGVHSVASPPNYPVVEIVYTNIYK